MQRQLSEAISCTECMLVTTAGSLHQQPDITSSHRDQSQVNVPLTPRFTVESQVRHTWHQSQEQDRCFSNEWLLMTPHLLYPYNFWPSLSNKRATQLCLHSKRSLGCSIIIVITGRHSRHCLAAKHRCLSQDAAISNHRISERLFYFSADRKESRLQETQISSAMIRRKPFSVARAWMYSVLWDLHLYVQYIVNCTGNELRY